MKNKTTLILSGIVLILCIAAILVVPRLFPRSVQQEQSSSQAPVSSETTVYTAEEALAFCDSVVTGTVIKADVVSDGVQYTLQIGRVYKGRNYTSMGYAFVKGTQTLELAKTYLFTGVSGTEKYHYYEPFVYAPWIYLVEDGTIVSHASNGDAEMVSGMIGASLETVKSICEGQKTSSK